MLTLENRSLAEVQSLLSCAAIPIEAYREYIEKYNADFYAANPVDAANKKAKKNADSAQPEQA